MCRSRASNRAFFALVFDPPLCVTPGGKHPIIFEPGFRAPDGTVAEIVGVGHYKKKAEKEPSI